MLRNSMSRTLPSLRRIGKAPAQLCPVRTTSANSFTTSSTWRSCTITCAAYRPSASSAG